MQLGRDSVKAVGTGLATIFLIRMLRDSGSLYYTLRILSKMGI